MEFWNGFTEIDFETKWYNVSSWTIYFSLEKSFIVKKKERKKTSITWLHQSIHGTHLYSAAYEICRARKAVEQHHFRDATRPQSTLTYGQSAIGNCWEPFPGRTGPEIYSSNSHLHDKRALLLSSRIQMFENRRKVLPAQLRASRYL